MKDKPLCKCGHPYEKHLGYTQEDFVKTIHVGRCHQQKCKCPFYNPDWPTHYKERKEARGDGGE